jgi:hypothetical protein
MIKLNRESIDLIIKAVNKGDRYYIHEKMISDGLRRRLKKINATILQYGKDNTGWRVIAKPESHMRLVK